MSQSQIIFPAERSPSEYPKMIIEINALEKAAAQQLELIKALCKNKNQREFLFNRMSALKFADTNVMLSLINEPTQLPSRQIFNAAIECFERGEQQMALLESLMKNDLMFFIQKEEVKFWHVTPVISHPTPLHFLLLHAQFDVLTLQLLGLLLNIQNKKEIRLLDNIALLQDGFGGSVVHYLDSPAFFEKGFKLISDEILIKAALQKGSKTGTNGLRDIVRCAAEKEAESLLRMMPVKQLSKALLMKAYDGERTALHAIAEYQTSKILNYIMDTLSPMVILQADEHNNFCDVIARNKNPNMSADDKALAKKLYQDRRFFLTEPMQAMRTKRQEFIPFLEQHIKDDNANKELNLDWVVILKDAAKNCSDEKDKSRLLFWLGQRLLCQHGLTGNFDYFYEAYAMFSQVKNPDYLNTEENASLAVALVDISGSFFRVDNILSADIEREVVIVPSGANIDIKIASEPTQECMIALAAMGAPIPEIFSRALHHAYKSMEQQKANAEKKSAEAGGEQKHAPEPSDVDLSVESNAQTILRASFLVEEDRDIDIVFAKKIQELQADVQNETLAKKLQPFQQQWIARENSQRLMSLQADLPFNVLERDHYVKILRKINKLKGDASEQAEMIQLLCQDKRTASYLLSRAKLLTIDTANFDLLLAMVEPITSQQLFEVALQTLEPLLHVLMKKVIDKDPLFFIQRGSFLNPHDGYIFPTPILCIAQYGDTCDLLLPLVNKLLEKKIRLELSDLKTIRGVTLCTLFLDRKINIDSVFALFADAEINKEAPEFFRYEATWKLLSDEIKLKLIAKMTNATISKIALLEITPGISTYNKLASTESLAVFRAFATRLDPANVADADRYSETNGYIESNPVLKVKEKEEAKKIHRDLLPKNLVQEVKEVKEEIKKKEDLADKEKEKQFEEIVSLRLDPRNDVQHIFVAIIKALTGSALTKAAGYCLIEEAYLAEESYKGFLVKDKFYVVLGMQHEKLIKNKELQQECEKIKNSNGTLDSIYITIIKIVAQRYLEKRMQPQKTNNASTKLVENINAIAALAAGSDAPILNHVNTYMQESLKGKRNRTLCDWLKPYHKMYEKLKSALEKAPSNTKAAAALNRS